MDVSHNLLSKQASCIVIYLHDIIAQSAGAIEYTDYISAEE